MKIIKYIAILSLAFIIYGCSVNPVTGKKEFMIFSDEQEINFGKEADPDIQWEFGGVYDDSKLSAYINSVGQKTASVSDRNKIPYHFQIVDTSVINAFALPGGYVYITRGLLVRLDNEAQLSAVLGHEIGHVNARHSMKRMQSTLGFNMLLALLDQAAGGSKSYQEWRGLIKTGSSAAFAAVSLGYGRDNEFEADALGTKYADKAGYDPQGMVQLLELLKSLSEREPSSIEEFFMSHPKTSDRIKNANGDIAKLPPQNPVGVIKQTEYKSNINDLLAVQKAYDHYDKAEELRSKGDDNQALSEYNQALKIRNLAKPHYGIGRIYSAQKTYDQAINEYKSAIRIDTGSISAYNSMGIAYMNLKQYNDAVTAFKKAASLYENYGDAWANLGEADYSLKQYPDALKVLEMALTLNGKHPRAYTTLGLTYEATGDKQKAIEAYEQAVNVAPKESYTDTARQRLAELKK